MLRYREAHVCDMIRGLCERLRDEDIPSGEKEEIIEKLKLLTAVRCRLNKELGDRVV